MLFSKPTARLLGAPCITGGIGMTANSFASEPAYEVVWPLGPSVYETRAPNTRIADLSGKTIGELWDFLFRGEDIFPLLRAELKARYPGIRFVTYDVFGNVHGPQQRELVADVPRLLKQHGCDAVISAIGA
jgi:hypothetical protein